MTYLCELIERLRVRASIRRQITTRKSVQEGKPDRLIDLLEEAADCIEMLKNKETVPQEQGGRQYLQWVDAKPPQSHQ